MKIIMLSILTLFGVFAAVVELRFPQTLISYLLLKAISPGMLLVAAVFLLTGIYFVRFIRSRWRNKCDAEIRNFLPALRIKCIVMSTGLSGYGLLAGMHWMVTGAGYGLGVLLCCALLVAWTSWLAYNLGWMIGQVGYE